MKYFSNDKIKSETNSIFFLIEQGRNKRAGCEKKIGFVIKQAKNFASRVAKYLKIVPEHAGLLDTRE